jgi:hypothetical protein
MVDNDPQVIAILSKMAIFKGLDRSQIETIAAHFEIVQLNQGERLFSQNERGEHFFIIQSGRIQVSRIRNGVEQKFTAYSNGDYIGEESLLSGQERTVSAEAVTDSRLLRMNSVDFKWMLRQFPSIKLFMDATVKSRRLRRKKRLDWLNDNETIYLMVQKHPAYLYTHLIGPLLLAWASVPVLLFSSSTDVSSFHFVSLWIGLLILAAAVGWGVWNYVDWGNDYYIVTNMRVIWLEKVVGIYDSRVEAPLNTVLTVGTRSDQLGRIMGYGEVIVRTYTGHIFMNEVGYPEQLASLIEEQLWRSKQGAKREEMAALEQTIRVRLGMEPASKPISAQAQVASVAIKKKAGPKLFENFFKIRLEENGIITYRKHWILLVQKAWQPTLVLFILLAVILLRALNNYTFLPAFFIYGVGGLFILFGLFWWAYEYVDWSNDIYQVSADQIIDIYRKPLGKEDKRVAPLENILSMEHTRRGIIGIIFNYGDVIAMVGAAKFVFQGVYDPAAVEQDIFRRIGARKQAQKEAEAVREREQIADWLEAYHNQTEGLHKKENPTNFDQNSG